MFNKPIVISLTY